MHTVEITPHRARKLANCLETLLRGDNLGPVGLLVLADLVCELRHAAGEGVTGDYTEGTVQEAIGEFRKSV